MAAFSTIALAVAATATVGSMYYGNKAAKQQKKANEFQRKQANLQAARSRRDQVRQNRLALAGAQVSAEAGGVSRSSGAAGGQGSIQSQGLSNLTFIDNMNKLSDQASVALGKAITNGNYAQMFSGVADLAMAFYNPQPTTPAQAQGTTPKAMHTGMSGPSQGRSNLFLGNPSGLPKTTHNFNAGR